jgi:hypothetical protein
LGNATINTVENPVSSAKVRGTPGKGVEIDKKEHVLCLRGELVSLGL